MKKLVESEEVLLCFMSETSMKFVFFSFGWLFFLFSAIILLCVRGNV